MSNEVRTIEVILTLEVNADEFDSLPDEEGILSFFGESQTPISGAQYLGNRIVDSCIKASMQCVNNARVEVVLDDAVFKIGERHKQVNPFDSFF
jgi:hypothetical protein